MVLVQIWQIQFLFKSLSFYRVIIVAADSYYKVWWVSQLLPIERCRLNDWKLESWLLAVETWSQRRWHASEIQRVHTDGDSRSTVSQWFHKINVFLLLEDRFAASVIPPTISTSQTYNLSARPVPNYLQLNTPLVHKAPSGQPVHRDILLTGSPIFVPLRYVPHTPLPGSCS